jgi:NtrC-family two-component system sensor histidine kinase KinB
MDGPAARRRPRFVTLGLGRKLTIAFGGLLALVLAAGAASIAVLGGYSSTLERIFRENYDSVHYAQEMKDAVDSLDAIAERSLWNEGASAAEEGDAAISQFETNLERAVENITLPGEAEAAASLGAEWKGYRAAFERSLSNPDPLSARRRFYRDELLARAVDVKRLAHRIIELNMANMVSVDGEVRVQAIRTRRTMYAFMLMASVLAALIAAVMARSILAPLRHLTSSAREIGRGNLDLVVDVASGDEIGELAEAFNAMAARLREFRRSDRARFVRTERTTQLALDSFPDPVALLGPDGRIELANQAAERDFDLRPGADLSAEQHTALRRVVEGALATATPFRPDGYQDALRPIRGGDRHFQPHAVPIPADDGSIAGVTLVLADVTNLRRLDETKSNLVSVVSHELRTPLTSIRMATHLLEEGKAGPLTGRQQELLTAAREEGDRLHTIIESLLDMGRLQSGRTLLELEPVEAASLVDEAVREFDERYTSAGVALTRDVEPSVGRVMADRHRLRHVFSNLLENSLRYCAGGGSVAIRVAREGAFACFTVADDGAGIAVESLPKVFDRFYRAPEQPVESGAGLGLAIVKEIVEAHGGRVSVESAPGRGTTVRFHLAIATSDSI